MTCPKCSYYYDNQQDQIVPHPDCLKPIINGKINWFYGINKHWKKPSFILMDIIKGDSFYKCPNCDHVFKLSKVTN